MRRRILSLNRPQFAMALLMGIVTAPVMAQSGAADGPTFDVASVKPNKSDREQHSNVPLGTGTLYSPTGGFFSATNVPLSRYISFAYRISLNQLQPMLAQLPSWVATDGFIHNP
jgi:hypothetical protein